MISKCVYVCVYVLYVCIFICTAFWLNLIVCFINKLDWIRLDWMTLYQMDHKKKGLEKRSIAVGKWFPPTPEKCARTHGALGEAVFGSEIFHHLPIWWLSSSFAFVYKFIFLLTNIY